MFNQRRDAQTTFGDRLWTIFEIAGFLNTHRNDDGVSSGLIIMPTFLGPTAVAIFLSAAMINMSI